MRILINLGAEIDNDIFVPKFFSIHEPPFTKLQGNSKSQLYS